MIAGALHHVRILLVVGVAVIAAFVPGRARAAGFIEHERYALPNGLDVVLHVDRRMPIIAFNLTYHVGSLHDEHHKGVAHLVEHLMFRGTYDIPDGQFVSRQPCEETPRFSRDWGLHLGRSVSTLRVRHLQPERHKA